MHERGRRSFGNHLYRPRLSGAMSDLTRQTGNESSAPTRSRWILPSFLVLILFVAGGALFWAINQHGTNPSSVGAAPPQAEPVRMAEAADEARPALADLQQTVSSLESAQQQVADQISELQRQLLNQQGERKLLSEQVGALSARVDSLMDSTAATPVPTGPPAQKRRAPR